jgi:hypothetical protein
MARTKFRVPFNLQGSLLHHAVERYSGSLVEWRENVPFEATVRMNHHRRGRSATYFVWTDDKGHEYPMFMTDLLDLVANSVIDKGVVTARWVVSKYGQNYGIKLYSED